MNVANEKIRQLFIGRFLSFAKGSTLTKMEFKIMGSMIRGSDPQDIAQDLDLDIRSVYAYKQRIEKRMGRKLNSLFIDSHPVTREQPSPLPTEKRKAELVLA